MIKTLRRKVILVTMSIVLLSLAGIAMFIIMTTQRGLSDESLRTLNMVSAKQAFFGSGQSPDSVADQQDSHVKKPAAPMEAQIPYFTIQVSSDGEVTSVDGEYYTLEDAELLDEIASAALVKDAPSGVLRTYSLRYLKMEAPDGTSRIAFVDTTGEEKTLRILIINLLSVSAGVLVVFFVLSLFLSKWILRPVEEAWERQRQFIADASHELKTPLTVILANAEMLSAHPGDRAEDRDRWIDNIKSEGRLTRRLVESMLQQAQLDCVSQKTPYEALDLSYIISESALMFEPSLYEAGLKLDCDIAENLSVKGDADQLRQLTGILLDNARKYSEPRGTISVSLIRGAKNTVVLSVSNSGDPIPEDKRDHIFERFYRLDTARSPEGGYGLGLSIAKGISEAHHGGIKAESFGRVNTFTVTLPATK
ncbi:MAG: sensor histidine kinase [Oscillospiraceae bacterium]